MKYYLPLALLLLTACAQTPDYKRPDMTNVPAAWSNAPTSAISAAQPRWSDFNDATLAALLQQALANNTDVNAGIARVQQSRAAVKIAGADLLPSVNASGNASRNHDNPANGSSRSGTSINAGLSASYELDLLGGNRASVAAAKAGLEASDFDLQALQLVVAGDVARNYFQLSNLQERLAISTSNLEIAKDVLRIVQARVDAGSASPLELSQQQTAVNTSLAAQQALEQQVAETKNALAILTGQAPQNFSVAPSALETLAIPAWKTEQPASLLETRPDIRAAEANLKAANANIQVARAAYFPPVTLSAGGTLAAVGLSDPVGTGLSLAVALTAPIFNGGRIEGGIEQASARQQELVQNYRGTILTAFGDGENALKAIQTSASRAQSLQSAKDAAQEAYRIARARFDAGAVDFQALLDTQAAQLSAQDSYAQAHLSQFNAAIALLQAMGTPIR